MAYSSCRCRKVLDSVLNPYARIETVTGVAGVSAVEIYLQEALITPERQAAISSRKFTRRAASGCEAMVDYIGLLATGRGSAYWISVFRITSLRSTEQDLSLCSHTKEYGQGESKSPGMFAVKRV